MHGNWYPRGTRANSAADFARAGTAGRRALPDRWATVGAFYRITYGAGRYRLVAS
jgi:hypothetical protein